MYYGDVYYDQYFRSKKQWEDWYPPSTHCYSVDEVLDAVTESPFKHVLEEILAKPEISPRQQEVINTAIRNAQKYRRLERRDCGYAI